MQLKLGLATTLAAVTAILCGITIAPAATAAPGGSPNLTGIPVTGTLPLNGTFNGTANITSFALQNGQLVANGTLTGTLLNAAGAVIGNVTNVPITLPVNLPGAGGACQILDLTLGPLDLNLLGLMVHLDATELRITADPTGGLLGSLLCSLAGGVKAPTTPTTPTPPAG